MAIIQYTPKKFDLATAVKNLHTRAPLIYCMTNYVTADFVANALKSIGASPIMAHAKEEMLDLINIADALLINIGTLDENWLKSVTIAATEAQKKDIPIILDPVGAGATSYRTAASKHILQNHRVSAVRGNASEIIALLDQKSKTRGVDALHIGTDALEAAQKLSQKHACIVIVSGKIDYVIEENNIIQTEGGDPLMTSVVGTGCVSSAIVSAFLATKKSDSIEAAAYAMAFIKKSAEMAAQTHPEGPASFKMEFIDALYKIAHANI